ncbi:Uncharacterised protein [Mycobacteroides abscessus subsp. abscessus]|nr:Uncharacterised protein [Mycobacteroides abscessus subsp. abscessus]
MLAVIPRSMIRGTIQAIAGAVPAQVITRSCRATKLSTNAPSASAMAIASAQRYAAPVMRS